MAEKDMPKFAKLPIMSIFASFSCFCMFCLFGPPHHISRPLFAAMDPKEHTRDAHEYHTTIIGFIAANEAPPV
jgi:hypothetical protein